MNRSSKVYSVVKRILILLALAAVLIFCCPPLDAFSLIFPYAYGCDRGVHRWIYSECYSENCDLCGIVKSVSYPHHDLRYDYMDPCRTKRTCTRCDYTETHPGKHELVTDYTDPCFVKIACLHCDYNYIKSERHQFVNQYHASGCYLYCTVCEIEKTSYAAHEYEIIDCGEVQYCIHCRAKGRIQTHVYDDNIIFKVCQYCGDFVDRYFIIPIGCYALIAIALFIVVVICTIVICLVIIWGTIKKRNFSESIFIPLRILPPDICSMHGFCDTVFLCFHDKFRVE